MTSFESAPQSSSASEGTDRSAADISATPKQSSPESVSQPWPYEEVVTATPEVEARAAAVAEIVQFPLPLNRVDAIDKVLELTAGHGGEEQSNTRLGRLLQREAVQDEVARQIHYLRGGKDDSPHSLNARLRATLDASDTQSLQALQAIGLAFRQAYAVPETVGQGEQIAKANARAGELVFLTASLLEGWHRLDDPTVSDTEKDRIRVEHATVFTRYAQNKDIPGSFQSLFRTHAQRVQSESVDLSSTVSSTHDEPAVPFESFVIDTLQVGEGGDASEMTEDVLEVPEENIIESSKPPVRRHAEATTVEKEESFPEIQTRRPVEESPQAEVVDRLSLAPEDLWQLKRGQLRRIVDERWRLRNEQLQSLSPTDQESFTSAEQALAEVRESESGFSDEWLRYLQETAGQYNRSNSRAFEDTKRRFLKNASDQLRYGALQGKRGIWAIPRAVLDLSSRISVAGFWKGVFAPRAARREVQEARYAVAQSFRAAARDIDSQDTITSEERFQMHALNILAEEYELISVHEIAEARTVSVEALRAKRRQGSKERKLKATIAEVRRERAREKEEALHRDSTHTSAEGLVVNTSFVDSEKPDDSSDTKVA